MLLCVGAYKSVHLTHAATLEAILGTRSSDTKTTESSKLAGGAAAKSSRRF